MHASPSRQPPPLPASLPASLPAARALDGGYLLAGCWEACEAGHGTTDDRPGGERHGRMAGGWAKREARRGDAHDGLLGHRAAVGAGRDTRPALPTRRGSTAVRGQDAGNSTTCALRAGVHTNIASGVRTSARGTATAVDMGWILARGRPRNCGRGTAAPRRPLATCRVRDSRFQNPAATSVSALTPEKQPRMPRRGTRATKPQNVASRAAARTRTLPLSHVISNLQAVKRTYLPVRERVDPERRGKSQAASTNAIGRARALCT